MSVAIETALIRASCFFCAFLSLLTVYVLSDVWRIERRTGRSISSVAVALLAAAVLMVGLVFGRGALYGRMPSSAPAEGCP